MDSLMDPAAGDRVRVDIPDETDPDHDLYHGREGIVVERLQDDADEVTGNEGDSLLYRLEFENGNRADFRQQDLRPAFSE